MRHAVESFFKRRFYVVHLLLLAVAAVLCARTTTAVAGHFVAERIKEKAGANKPHARVPPPRVGPARDFNRVSEENIFDGKREVVATQAVAPVDTGSEHDANECEGAPATTLRLRLVGTVVFSEQESSVASIVDESQGSRAEASMYSINDCDDDAAAAVDDEDPDAKLAAKPAPCSRVGDSAVLKRIEPETVCIWNDSEHRMESLDIAAKAAPRAPLARASRAPPRRRDDNLGASIHKTGDNSYEVGQSEVDKALNNLAQLSTQARIVPAFEGGKTVGFKLFSIRPGSLYSKVGLQNGDVITRINGYEMTSPEKGLEIYTKLKDSKAVTVDLKRRGKPLSLDYNIVQ